MAIKDCFVWKDVNKKQEFGQTKSVSNLWV